MSDLMNVKERELVIPGEEIIKSMDYLPGKNCFRDRESVLAKRIGIVSVSGRVITVIPLAGVYTPKVGDMVIAEVDEVQHNGWILNINSVFDAYLPLSGVRDFIDTTKTELSSVYARGDILYAKVSLVNNGSIHLSMVDPRARKFRTGRIIKMSSPKVPRLIGKRGSMISMIKDRTGCRINVGQNGLIWMEGENEELAIRAIKLIEENAHTGGLTDKVAALLGGSNEKPKQEDVKAADTKPEDTKADAEKKAEKPKKAAARKPAKKTKEKKE